MLSFCDLKNLQKFENGPKMFTKYQNEIFEKIGSFITDLEWFRACFKSKSLLQKYFPPKLLFEHLRFFDQNVPMMKPFENHVLFFSKSIYNDLRRILRQKVDPYYNIDSSMHSQL